MIGEDGRANVRGVVYNRIFGVCTSVLLMVGYVFLTQHSAGSDFIQFYAGLQLGLSGGNPYDPTSMRQLQGSLLGVENIEPILFWSHPLSLLIALPGAFSISHGDMVGLWYWISIVTFAVCGLMVWHGAFEVVNRSPLPLALMCGFISAPFLMVLSLGQSSALLLVFLTGMLLALLRRAFFWTGFFMGCLLVKPHLVLLLVGIASLLVVTRQYPPSLLGGLLGGVLCCMALSEAVFPGAIVYWLQVLLAGTNEQGVVSREIWISSTFGGYLRASFDPLAFWVSPALFMSTFVFFAWLIVRRRMVINLERDVVWLLSLGLVVSPLGWFYDAVLLMPLQILAIASANSHARWWIGILLVGWNILWGAAYLIGVFQLHHLFWPYPLALLFLGLFIRHASIVSRLSEAGVAR